MIHVTRAAGQPQIPVYTARTCIASDGQTKLTRYERERELAIAFFTDPRNYSANKKLCKTNFAFAAYKNPELIARLAADFNLKCAYCESDFRAVTPSDIEHYRPKAAITTKTTKLRPGYFWLAGDYANLLISCPDCNRPRGHTVPGQTENTVLGKGSQFPLADETLRARAHDGGIAVEDGVRLLLDPCHDNPEEHLEFDATGNVRPRKRHGVSSAIGATSIDVYALRRKGLVEKRFMVLTDLAAVFDELNQHVAMRNLLQAEASSQELLARNLKLIGGCMAKLFAMFSKKSEYLAAKRDWIRNGDAMGQFAALRAFKIEPLELLTLAA
ncbi:MULTISPECIES: hypothetical protein [Rhizobium]|uniref:hypothetical protein n=1 Tax=Rhizobium TaxID=379 RepID=UPI000362DEB9|nr:MULTISPECIES: hypothetical protein [Rhizobium]AVC45695.1 hypothetical protein RLV_1709 [Rhizobium leguminosarum bv. viciae]MBX5159616.1 hypothetical protein [Rhizobium sp. NZLR8]TCA84438.1 hypothetical protein E0H74_15215 [Rhizobium leguminosarum bv. viciae]TCA94671.1 hypothetical protein E0H76_18285 [Rhizobium leguminosarum bv. viciae]